MRVNFGNGFVSVPSRNICFNPDRVVMIQRNGDDNLCSVSLSDNGHIPNINAPVSEVMKSCLLAQKNGENVEITENNNLNLSA